MLSTVVVVVVDDDDVLGMIKVTRCFYNKKQECIPVGGSDASASANNAHAQSFCIPPPVSAKSPNNFFHIR